MARIAKGSATTAAAADLLQRRPLAAAEFCAAPLGDNMVLTEAGALATRTRGLGRGVCFLGPLQLEQGAAYFEVEVAEMQRSSQTMALGVCAALPASSKPVAADRAKDLGPGTCVLGYDLPKFFAHGMEISRLPVKQWRPVKDLAIGDRVGLLIERVTSASSSILGSELSLSVAVNGATRLSVRVPPAAQAGGSPRWPQELWGVVDVHGGVKGVRLPGAGGTAVGSTGADNGSDVFCATQAHPSDGGRSPLLCAEAAAGTAGCDVHSTIQDTLDHNSCDMKTAAAIAAPVPAQQAPAASRQLRHSMTVAYQKQAAIAPEHQAAHPEPLVKGDSSLCREGPSGLVKNANEDASSRNAKPGEVAAVALAGGPPAVPAVAATDAAATADTAAAPSAEVAAAGGIGAAALAPSLCADGAADRAAAGAVATLRGKAEPAAPLVPAVVAAEPPAAKRQRLPPRAHDCGCMVHLIQHTGGVVHVPGTDFVIGRNKLICNLTLDSPLVPNMASRKHAHIVCSGDGEVKIIDCDSLNGTWVNGNRVSHQTLQQNDVLVIGNPMQSPPDFCFSVSLPPPLRPP